MSLMRGPAEYTKRLSIFVCLSYRKMRGVQCRPPHVVVLSEFSFPPPSYSRRHLHRCSAPVLAMVVPCIHAANSRALQRLVFRERGKDPEYDRHTRVELHAHECMRDALTDVLEMHGRAFDEHPDRDHRVEWPIVRGRKRERSGYRRASDRRGGAGCGDTQSPQQICHTCAGLNKRPSDHPTNFR
jgi:hypothetical protein